MGPGGQRIKSLALQMDGPWRPPIFSTLISRGMPLTLDFGHWKHVDSRGIIGFEQHVSSGDQRYDAVHYLQVAALVLSVYDHFLTFDREFEYIWSREWSISSILYILTRYGGNLMLIAASIVFLNQHVTHSCLISLTNEGDIGIKVVGGVAMVIILLSQVVMQLRIKTLYRRRMSTIINVLWGLEIVAAAAIGIVTTYFIEVRPSTVGLMHVCTVTRFPAYAAVFWLPILLFEIFLFVLSFRIAWYNHHQLGSWRGARLLHVVLRDNFSFFVLVFIAYLLTAVIWLVAGPQYFLMPAMLSCSFTIIMGCRFILNLFQAYHTPCGIMVESARSQSAWPPLLVCGLHFVELPVLKTNHPRPPSARGQTNQTESVDD